MTPPGRTRPLRVETFSVAEAAEALGTSLNTMRRWISESIIPIPVLHDTVRNHNCYSAGELEVVAQELHRHFGGYSYLSASHTETVTRISQALHGHRDVNFNTVERIR